MSRKERYLDDLLKQGLTARAVRRRMSRKGFSLDEYTDVQLTNLILKAKSYGKRD